MSFTASLAISGVAAAVWVLVITQAVIFWLFGSGVIAIVDGDMAVLGELVELVMKALGLSVVWVDASIVFVIIFI